MSIPTNVLITRYDFCDHDGVQRKSCYFSPYGCSDAVDDSFISIFMIRDFKRGRFDIHMTSAITGADFWNEYSTGLEATNAFNSYVSRVEHRLTSTGVTFWE